jgi:hypothetical protein
MIYRGMVVAWSAPVNILGLSEGIVDNRNLWPAYNIQHMSCYLVSTLLILMFICSLHCSCKLPPPDVCCFVTVFRLNKLTLDAGTRFPIR